ncbi:MAG: DNA-binding protein WhiA [Caldiserica bacterium]|nr:MAG: DNA-binding protein WhiA [Caldisericota bacterium]
MREPSFTSLVKKELISFQPINEDEILAEVKGILLASGLVVLKRDSIDIVFKSTDPQILRRIILLSKKIMGNEREVLVEKGKRRKFYKLIHSFNKRNFFLSGIIDNDDLKVHFKPKSEKEASAFLRGVFLGCGTVTDPRKEYYLELRLSEDSSFFEIMELVQILHFNFKSRIRRNKRVLYLQSRNGIKEFLGFIGASSSFLSLLDQEIKMDLKESLTTKINYEMRNIGKIVDSYLKIRDAILFLKKEGVFNNLTPALKKAAEVRLKYPDKSLREVAGIIGISKSALNHRLRRILKIKEKLKGGTKKRS